MRPSSSGVINPSGLVDKRLQPMWTKIEQVRQLLPQIAHVSYYMESIFNLDRNLTLLADENVDHHILKDIQIFQGANAYEIALAEGYVGDVTSWLASLVGPKGDTGLLDTAAHQVLIDGIAANVAAAAAAQATADAAVSNFTNYVPLSTYNTRVAAVDAVLANLETTITDVIIPLLPIVRSDTEIGDIAQAKINTSLINVNNALTAVNATLSQYEIDILSLSTENSATSTAFSEFLVDYGDTLAAITLLTASYNDHETSIVSIQSASALAASNIITLQANDATFSSQITSLQLAEADAATQINVLQIANNDNYAAILSEQSVRISDIAAAAADRALIRTEFASADSGVLSSATALVDAETTARTTALSAAAADRSLIRTEFASADSGILSSATALIDAETSARSTALAAAASDRTLIRTEFASADDAVSAAAAALVSAEASARSTAIDAVTSSVTTLSSTVGGLSSTVSTQGSTLADINGRLEARYAISVDGGGGGSFISLEDGTTIPSVITLSSSVISLDGNVLVTGSVVRSAIDATERTTMVAEGMAANYYEDSSDPGSVPNGSWWYKTTTYELYVRRSGSWSLVARLTNPQLSLSKTSGGYVATKIGTGTNTTGSIVLAATGGDGSYTYSHELVIIDDPYSISPSLSTTTGTTFAVNASSQSPVKEVTFMVISTVTDGAGRSSQYIRGGGLFWET